MDRSTDLVLRRVLKNWTSHAKPPDNGRERLLWEAASPKGTRAREISWFIVNSLGDLKTNYYSDLYWPVMDGFQRHSAVCS
jgi:hypothetical protein